MKNGQIITAIALLLGACVDDSLDEPQIFVDSQPITCVGESQSLCLRVKYGGQQQWQWHYGGINGFEYQWGYSYVLTYAEIDVKDPPADGSSTELVLLKTVSQTEDAIGTEYNFAQVSLQDSTITHTDDEYAFIGYPFVCAEGLDCDALLMLSNDDVKVDLRFRYIGDAQVELVSWQNGNNRITAHTTNDADVTAGTP